MQSVRHLAGVCSLTVLLIACGGDDLEIDAIEKVPASDGQTAPAEARLPVPLAVITRSSDGAAVPRVRVQWLVDAGGGSLSDSVSWSDANGRAQVDFWVGRSVGAYTVRARLASKQSRSVTFNATAVAAPSLSQVAPPTFSGGDVITVQGTGLSASAIVEIGGAPAAVTGGTTTSLTVTVPVCLPAGQTGIRARLNGATSNTLNGTFVSGATLQLAVGQYASIDPAQLAGCAGFPAAGLTGAEYLVAPQSTGAAGASSAYRLVGNQVPIAVPPMNEVVEEPVAGPARAFHDFLRGRERALSLAPRPAVPAPARAEVAMAPVPRLGDQKQFSVCSRLPCTELADFTKVTARAKYVGSHVALFQDVSVPAGGYEDSEFEPLGRLFNDVLYDVDTRAFGVESDVDDNRIVYMLFTPVVNRLTTGDCNAGVITGFFYAIDIDPGYATDARANQAEIFYALVPDPQGSIHCTIPKSRIGQIVPSTFIHEFQHMISYGQHVVFRKGLSEDTWLNEGLSHLAEELGALKLRELGDDQAFSDFVIGDLFDAFLYLKAPGNNYVSFSEGSGTLAERGSSWLFLRWVVDKFGPDVTRRLVETNRIGTENLAAAVGEPLSWVLPQWFLANYVSDLPGFTPPPRLKYDTWEFRTTYQSLNSQNPSRFDRPYPLVPPVVNGGSFDVTGNLLSGSGDYYRVTQAPSQPGFTLLLTTPAGAPLPAAVAARLNVVRIR